MELSVKSVAVLLLIAAVVAMLTRRLRLPYSVGLVAAGILLALAPFSPKVELTRDLIFTALLPPLLFEAAFFLPWQQLRRDFLLITILATAGVLISAAISALGMHSLAQWPWQSAIVFGTLIAATDPVSVIATFREANTRGRLLLVIESESLFNDGTAAVAFGIATAAIVGLTPGPLQMSTMIVTTVGGGVVCGAAVAACALWLVGRTDDHLVEITFTTVAAYGSFLLAEQFHLSGVLATITAGLVMGNLQALGAISQRGKDAVRAFWEYAAFVANSMVFLLIGMHETHQNFAAVWLPALAAIALVTVGRAAAIYSCCALFSRSSRRVTAAHQHAMFWGGLRGALALALALSLPREVPLRDQIITVCFAVVAFSIFVQGLTMTPLLRHLKELP